MRIFLLLFPSLLTAATAQASSGNVDSAFNGTGSQGIVRVGMPELDRLVALKVDASGRVYVACSCGPGRRSGGSAV